MFSACCIAAPHSGTGKTTLSMGLMRLLSRKYKVQPFKCGPDYIDTGYHKLACQRFSYNLDSWLMGEKGVKSTFFSHTKDCDIAIAEGVMGLFDGKQISKQESKTHNCCTVQHNNNLPKNIPPILGSTAHIAQILNLPILLIVDCKGMAQSISAIVRGFQAQCKDYGLNLNAIIANNIGSERHFNILKDSLENWNLPPLLGYVPTNLGITLKERQLGLPHIFESKTEPADNFFNELNNNLDTLADILKDYIDIDKLISLTASNTNYTENIESKPVYTKKKNIAIAYDKAFCFYYQQNLEWLESNGYQLNYFSPLTDKVLPKTDAIYLGGGYPEIYAKELSQNTAMLAAIKEFAEKDGQIFAECGGFMYLCSSLKTQYPACTHNQDMQATHTNKTTRNTVQAENNVYPLCNVIDAEAIMGNRLRSLGYREGKFLTLPFFGNINTKYFRGHEFHWSDIILHKEYAPFLEINNIPLGISYKNVRASYIHFYFADPQKEKE